MSRVFLFHWHEQEAAERAAKLAAMGHEVRVHWDRGSGSNSSGPKAIVADPPDAVIVDLARLPSHGMAVATWLRGRKSTRAIPLVFVEGDDESKVAAARAVFPDATFVPWSRMKAPLAKAIARPVVDPVVPTAPSYTGTPLPKKLGVKEQSRVVLVRAPAGFDATLGDLPTGAVVANKLGAEADVVLLFCRTLRELDADFVRAKAKLAARGGLWVCWPKKASGVLTELDDGKVRALGLGHGLVDNKVCAVDAVWSGLRFAHRVAK